MHGSFTIKGPNQAGVLTQDPKLTIRIEPKQGAQAFTFGDDHATSDRSSPAGPGIAASPKSYPPAKKQIAGCLTDSDLDDFTPAAPPSRHRCVLVAKCLTNSDAASGRIILPRVAVEANLPFVTGYRHYALAVRDARGRRYEFVIKSWANGTEHRRVFVLEQAAEYLRSHGVGVGDAIGICSDERGELVVEVNTPEVRHATVCPKYGATALAQPPPGSNNALPLAASGRCIRSGHCTKPAGHPGFCSGPKAAAAAAAAAKPRPLRMKHLESAHPTPLPHAVDSQASEGHTHFGEGYSSDETAATIATPLHANLPAGLHPFAVLPPGARLTKVLTAYDVSSRRVVMPAEAVDARIPNARRLDTLTLAAVDESQGWQFPTLRAWTSVAGRRGYMLEDASKFLTGRGAAAGDVLLVFRDSELTPPRIELRARDAGSEALTLRFPPTPDADCLTFAELPLLMHPKGRARGSHAGTPRAVSAGGAMVCHRTGGCTKAAGHQGFCSGHKGFKKREGGTPTAVGAGSHAFRVRTGRSLHGEEEDDEDYEWNGSGSEDEYVPVHKRARKAVTTPRADDPLVSLLSLLGR